MEQYASLAAYYDALNDTVDYDGWLEFIKKIFEKNGSSPASVLDLACGTGEMSVRLAKSGYETIGIDLSCEMLTLARNKAAEQNLDILLLNQDMASFELYGTVNAVICCLDSINYLTSADDVLSCFDTVHNYLDPNGLFVFDINSEYKFKNIYSDNAYVYETENLFCTWQNYYNPKNKMCDFYLDFFVEHNGLYERFSETQREKCYTLKQMATYLKKTNFEIIGIYSDFDFTEVDEKNQGETERFYIVCRKM